METVKTDETSGRERRIALLLSIALFVAACATPALELRSFLVYASPGKEQPQLEAAWGIRLLLAGWLAKWFPQFAWFANVTLMLGWIALARRWWRTAFLLAACSMIFAADLMRLVPGGTPSIGPINPRYYFIERPLAGCYLWLGSMAVLAVGAALNWRHRRSLREATALLLALSVLLGGAYGYARYIEPFDRWARETKMFVLEQRIRDELPVNATEVEAITFLRALGVEDEHIRLHLVLGQTDHIESWFPRPRSLFQPSYNTRVVVSCYFGGSTRMQTCLVSHDSGPDPIHTRRTVSPP